MLTMGIETEVFIWMWIFILMITMPVLNMLVAMLEKKMEIFAFVSQMSSNTMDFLQRMEKNSRKLSF